MSGEDAVSFSTGGKLLFIGGLLVVIVALFTLNLTIRTLTLWWHQGDYVRTELEVTGLSPSRSPLLFGIVAATGEEIHTSILPTEIFTYDSPSDATGTLKRSADIEGLRIPVWYCPRRHSIFGNPHVYYVSEYGTLPTARTALGVVAINLAIALLGALGIRQGLRTRAAAD